MRMLQLSETGKKVPIFLMAGTLILGAGACSDDSTGVELSSVRILLTDAPSDVIASAEVWISRVYLQGGDDEETEGGRVDLFNDPEKPQHYDLLTLQDGVTADLTGAVEVDVGLYGSLRLVVDRALVTLVEGVSFEDGTDNATLFVPQWEQQRHQGPAQSRPGGGGGRDHDPDRRLRRGSELRHPGERRPRRRLRNHLHSAPEGSARATGPDSTM